MANRELPSRSANPAEGPVRRRRGRPTKPDGEKRDRKAKRAFYQPLEDYQFFFDFCDGDISRELHPVMALWMALSDDMRGSVRKIAVKGKSLAEAVAELKPALPDILVDEALGVYIAELPRREKVALLSGQSVSLSTGSNRLKPKGKR